MTVSAGQPVREVRGSEETGSRIELCLLGGFELRAEHPVTLPMSVQRLVTFVALRGRPVGRAHAAAVLWPDSPEQRAVANLRSAVWRLHRTGLHLVSTEAAGQMSLHPSVDVDLHRAEALARRFLRGPMDDSVRPLDPDWELLAAELLPGWNEDWVLVEREHQRHMGLEALESAAEHLLREGRTTLALELALAVVAQDPLRESGHRVAMRIFLMEGNTFSALRQYRLYESLARRHLNLAPSHLMERLVHPLQDALGAA